MRGEVSFPLYDKQRIAIDAIVKTVNASYFGLTRFSKASDRAAAYLCYIIKRHPVTDGNKRLAVLWFEIYCTVEQLRPHPPVALDVLAIAIEQSPLPMHDLVDVTIEILFDDQ